MSKNVLILAGGGARGMFESSLLRFFEGKQGDTYKHYDLMVGASVGAINAAILSTGKISALDLYKIYPGVLKRIFKKKPWWKFPKFPIYSQDVFRAIWNEIIGEDIKFGEAKTNLMIASTNRCVDDLGYEQTRLFKSWKPEDAQLSMIDVVCTSFAAPIYFGNLCFPKLNSVFSDGGVGVNNFPGTETFLQIYANGWLNEDVTIDGIGTFYSVDKNDQDYKKLCKDNVFKQFWDFLSPTDGGEGSKMSTGEEIRKMNFICNYTPNLHFNFWDIELSADKIGMDKLQYLDLYREMGYQAFFNGPVKKFN